MGALHAGHLSLVRRAFQLADEVAVSIFVNPTQFAPSEDLRISSRPIDDDLDALRQAGVAMVFHPAPERFIPPGSVRLSSRLRWQCRLKGSFAPAIFVASAPSS